MTAFADFLTWRAEGLTALADEVNTLRRVASEAAEGYADARPRDWQGAAAEAAIALWARTQRAAQDHAADVARIVRALDAVSTDMGAALRRRDAALGRAARAEIRVAPDGSVTDASTAAFVDADEAAAYSLDRQRLVDDLADELGQAYAAATAADLALAAQLGTLFRSAGRVRNDAPDAPGLPSGDVDGYRIGLPTKPTIAWDEGFVWNSDSATPSDWLLREKWLAMLNAARILKPELDDGLEMYDHYWSNTGDPVTFDYEEAAREDSSVRINVNTQAANTARAVDDMIRNGQTGEFDITGPASGAPAYPATENWQKAIGAYQQWSSAHVSVHDGTVTMTVTVHAEDHCNFNRGQADIASGASDDENGRFTEIGWAKPFDTSGSVTRTLTWPVGAPPPSVDVVSAVPERFRGED